MPTLDTITGPLQAELGLAYDADITVDVLGEEIDLKDKASVGWFFTCTALTSGSLTLQIQVSDIAGGTYALDPSAKYTINDSEEVDAVGVFKIGYSGPKRFAKLSVVANSAVGITGIALAITDPNFVE